MNDSNDETGPKSRFIIQFGEKMHSVQEEFKMSLVK